MVAPASNAACVDSICSLMVIGTAGLSLFCGTDPVIATVIMQGVVIKRLLESSDSAMHLYAAVDITLACHEFSRAAQGLDRSPLNLACTFEIPVFAGVRHDQRSGKSYRNHPGDVPREPLLLT